MKTLMKIAAGIVVVFLAAALVVPMLFKGKIEQIVKREANELLSARLDFGSLDLSLLRHFPNASVELTDLMLSGGGEFRQDTLLAADRISVVVNLMSLFGDEGFQVKKIILSAVELDAHKTQSGAVNWAVMRGDTADGGGVNDPVDTRSEAVPEVSVSDDGAEESSPFQLSVSDFRIEDAVIRYADDSTKMLFSTEPLSLRLSGRLSAQKSRLHLNLLAGRVNFMSGGIPMLVDTETELKAVVEADFEQNKFTFADNFLRLNAITLKLDGWTQLSDGGVKMDLRAGCDKVRFKDLLSLLPQFYTRDFRSLSASGEMMLSMWAKGEMTEGTLPAFELRTGVSNGSFKYSSLPKAVNDIQIAARVYNPGGEMDKTVVDLSRFSLKMGENAFSASFYATQLASDALFRGALNGKIDLGMVKDIYPLEENVRLDGVISADVKCAGRMSYIEKGDYDRLETLGKFVIEKLSLALPSLPDVMIERMAASLSPEAMTLGECGITVGRSDLEANGQLTGYWGYLLRDETLNGRLYLKSRLLDLNEITGALPDTAGASEDGQSAETEPSAAEEPAEGVLRVPENLNLSLNTELEKIRFAKMNIEQLRGEMQLKNGCLSLDGLSLQALGGRGEASGSYSTAANPESPQLKLAVSLSDASFSRTFEELDFVQKLAPVFAKTGGEYGLSMDLSTQFTAGMKPDMKTMNARGVLSSKNIKVQNLEIMDMLAKTLGNNQLRNIEARDVTIRFAIRDGRLATQPFDLKMAGLNMNLSGSVGLDSSIDYVAKVGLPASGRNERLAVNIGGTLSSPKISLGVKESLKNALDEQIQQLTGGKNLNEEVARQAERLRREAENAGRKLVEAAQLQRDKLVADAASKNKLVQLGAQKAGDKLVEEAERQAQNLKNEAEKAVARLAGEGASAETK